MKYFLVKNGRRLSSVDYNDTTRKKPLNFRKNDYMFFSSKEEALKKLNHIISLYGDCGLKVVEG